MRGAGSRHLYGAAAVVCAAIAVACAEAPHSVIETRSPDVRYLVRLSGKFTDPRYFSDVHRVWVEIYRNNVPILEKREFHYAGFLDTGFRNNFKPAVWTAQNVLWFATDPVWKSRAPDELWVTNQLAYSIEYLQIDGRDRFIVLDFAAGSATPVRGNGFPRLY